MYIHSVRKKFINFAMALVDGNGFLKTDPWKLSVAENETVSIYPINIYFESFKASDFSTTWLFYYFSSLLCNMIL